ncbi:MAG: hypothetical protein OEY19_10345 [Gammaproteobacteria bacterium]|nr:hypothetical protein [Gammaproteobacteria bacterium]MDH5629196.1 hypothetical protein [Gammaproteobacteria bacterium]
MKKLILTSLIVFFSFNVTATERKAFKDISSTELTTETQAQAETINDKHISMVWWVPYEFWASIFSRDPNITDSARKEMLGILKDYSVLAVVQADVSSIGSFKFYSKEQVLSELEVSYTTSHDKKYSLSPDNNVSSDMELMMSQISPMLQAAMGNLGANFHFFIYRDTEKKGKRIINPYKKGTLSVTLKGKDDEKLYVEFKTPLNSLYVPRICPNGQKAHISWNYCPWSGKKL